MLRPFLAVGLAISLTASLAHASAVPVEAPGLEQLHRVYQAQLDALSNADIPALAATLDPESCESAAALLRRLAQKEPEALVLLTGVASPRSDAMPACDLLARATLHMSDQSSGIFSHRPSANVLGVVMEGGEIAHAVVRTTYQVRGTPLPMDELVSFHLGAAGWKVRSNTLVSSLSSALKAQGL